MSMYFRSTHTLLLWLFPVCLTGESSGPISCVGTSGLRICYFGTRSVRAGDWGSCEGFGWRFWFYSGSRLGVIRVKRIRLLLTGRHNNKNSTNNVNNVNSTFFQFRL